MRDEGRRGCGLEDCVSMRGLYIVFVLWMTVSREDGCRGTFLTTQEGKAWRGVR